jgi:hypothetical protein
MIADRDSDLDAFGSVDRCVLAPVPSAAIRDDRHEPTPQSWVAVDESKDPAR